MVPGEPTGDQTEFEVSAERAEETTDPDADSVDLRELEPRAIRLSESTNTDSS